MICVYILQIYINLIINATHINARLYNNIHGQRDYSLAEIFNVQVIISNHPSL